MLIETEPRRERATSTMAIGLMAAVAGVVLLALQTMLIVGA